MTGEAPETHTPAVGTPTRGLTAGYLVALTLIALVNVGAFVVVQLLMRTAQHDGPVINRAGRQRMLSQRLTGELLLLLRTPNEAAASALRAQALASLAELKRVHEGLRRGSTALNLPGANSTRTAALLERIEQLLATMERTVARLLALPPTTLAELTAESPPVAKLVSASQRLLTALDRLVFQFDRDAQARASRLAGVESGILVLAMLVLLLEALLIFRPMIRRVSRGYAALQSSNAALSAEVDRREQAERAQVRLEGILPICAACKKIRDTDDQWTSVEVYVESHSDAEFTHGLCPSCAEELYPTRNPTRS